MVIYGVRCMYTVLANPIHVALSLGGRAGFREAVAASLPLGVIYTCYMFRVGPNRTSIYTAYIYVPYIYGCIHNFPIIFWFIWNILLCTVYTAYIYVDGNPIYGLGQPNTC